jgi:hypothetical protein
VFRKIRDNLCATTAIVLALLPAARIFQGWVCRINSPREWDYGPAILAVAVRRIRHGDLLYNDFLRPPYPTVALYNPVAIYLAAMFAPLFHAGPIAELEAGRLLVLLATVATCTLIFLLTRRLGADRAAASILTLAFALSPLLQPWGFEFRVDMPALVFELAGLYLFHAGLLLPAGAAFVCAFFTKQSYVSGTAAAILYWALNSRWRHALALSAFWLVAVVFVMTLLRWFFPYYLLDAYLTLLPTPSYSYPLAVGVLGRFLLWQFPLVVIAALGLLGQGPRRDVMACYLMVALALNSLSSMRWGSNVYYFLPTLAAAAIVAGPPLSELLGRSVVLRSPYKVLLGAAIAWALIVPLMLAGVTDFSAIRRAIASHGFGCPYGKEPPWDEHAFQLLDSLKGPVLADDFAAILHDGTRHIEGIDFMALRQMLESGGFDDRPLVDDIEHRRIAAFALDQELLDRQWQGRKFFWPRLREAILDNYVPVPGVGPPYLMIPKPSTGAPSSAR